jgi:hypothetical protein
MLSGGRGVRLPPSPRLWRTAVALTEAGQADPCGPATAFAPNGRYGESRRSLRRRRKVSHYVALRTTALIVLSLALAATPAAAEVQLTIDGGRVTLSAKNATVGQILAEWAKVGQTRIVNGERVAGGPVSMELTNIPELDAIEILLRSAGGYVLAPRPVETAKASRYDRILIFPTSSIMSGTPRPTVAAAPPQAPPRPFPQPVQPNQPAAQSDDNDGPVERPNPAGTAVQNPRPPVFNTFPQPTPPPQTTTPPARAPASTLTAPVGVAVPGMVVPTPQPAGQPGAPAAPQQR